MTQWNKIFFFAILPAIIAGLFSIAPKIFDIVTLPKAELTYNSIDGPSLTTAGKIRKIQTIIIKNTGKKTLYNINALYEVDHGVIEQSEIKDLFSIKPTVVDSKKSLLLEFKTLHPKESLSISIMTLLEKQDSNSKFNVRSNETRGIIKEISATEKKGSKEIAGAFLSGFSVFLMGIMVLTGKLPLIMTKQDALYYIVAKLKIDIINKRTELFKSNLTYLRFADVLLSVGLGNDNKTEECIKALKCMLFIKNIAKHSLAVIKENLQTLEGEKFSQSEIEKIREKSVSVFNLISFRKSIKNYLDETSRDFEVVK